MAVGEIEKYFKVDFDERLGVVTLLIDKEGDKYNTFCPDFVLTLRDMLERYIANDLVRALIISAEGTKVFSAGADITGQFPYLDSVGAQRFSSIGQNVFKMLEHAPFITCAAVNGFALGGGFELALACDFRTASTRARMALPEINLGLLPGWGGTQRLPRIVGKAKALEMIISGEPVTAHEALAFGVVSAVFEPNELLSGTVKFLSKFLEKSRTSIELIKRAIHNGMRLTLDDGLNLESELFGLVWSGPDRIEGVNAYLEKRKPDFKK